MHQIEKHQIFRDHVTNVKDPDKTVMASVAHRLPLKPVLSTSFAEARLRALNLYRAWYREVRLLMRPQ